MTLMQSALACEVRFGWRIQLVNATVRDIAKGRTDMWRGAATVFAGSEA